MKITEKLTKFLKVPTLFIVTGKQDARLYFAHNDTIERIVSFRIKKPAYTDREGLFSARGGGRNIIATGNVLRPVDRSIRNDFTHELHARLLEADKAYQIKRVILFTPLNYQNETYSTLPQPLQKKVGLVIHGNYFALHPIKLIEKWLAKHLAGFTTSI